jgi:outer membrane protein OmpA-like peptidoglycan-associated protein
MNKNFVPQQAAAWLLWALAMLLGLGLAASAARALDPEAERILSELACKPGQDCEPAARRKRGFDRGSRKRNFSFEPQDEQSRAEIEDKVRKGTLPASDVEITFDYNSAVVGPEAQAALAPLGRALADPRLSGQHFVLVGHTDAVGSDAYNQALSERRAAAAKAWLIERFAIAPERLLTYGRGKSQLKAPEQPSAAINRRVQVINVGRIAEAR